MKWSRRGVLQSLGAATVGGCTTERQTGKWGSPTFQPVDTGTAPEEARPPNVLVIFPDQWRRDATPAMGDPNVQLPALEKFESESAVFRHMVTPSPVCTPARSSLLTGLYPWITETTVNDMEMPLWVTTLGNVFSGAGYQTAWIGKWHLYGSKLGYVPPTHRFGFNYWAANDYNHQYLNPVLFGASSTPERPEPGTWGPEWETDLAIDMMETMGDQPFFMGLSWGPPHPDLPTPTEWANVPEYLWSRVDRNALQLRGNVPPQIEGPTASDPYGVRYFLQGYYACLLGLDDAMARLMAYLESSGRAKDTIVVFASDHGEMGGSHSRYRKDVFFEESVGVPCSIRWPNEIQPRTIDHPVSLVDLFPTLTGLAGLPAIDGLHGADLTDLVMSGSTAGLRETAFIGRERPDGGRMVAVTDGRWKFAIEAKGTQFLFDLANDPFELENLVTAAPNERTRLADHLLEWLDHTGATGL